MAADPSEQFNFPAHEEVETFEGRSPLPLGEGALRATAGEQELLGGRTLFDAAFNIDAVDVGDVGEATMDMVDAAVEKGLLSRGEAKWLAARILSIDTPEPPVEYATGKNSTPNYLVNLLKDYPGELNHVAGKESQRHALAIKGLLHKFLRENMSVVDIQEWVGSINDPRNNFDNVQPEHVPLLLAGGLDTLFRYARNPVFKR